MSNKLRPERLIVLDCEAAANRIIGRCKGKAPAEIRCELRKAFPFGPEATASEKRIWEKTLVWAMKEVEKWPKAASMVVLALMITCHAACAEDLPVQEQAPPKVTFAVKHPKIHKGLRLFRAVCHFCQPILASGGSIAQIITSFK